MIFHFKEFSKKSKLSQEYGLDAIIEFIGDTTLLGNGVANSEAMLHDNVYHWDTTVVVDDQRTTAPDKGNIDFEVQVRDQ